MKYEKIKISTKDITSDGIMNLINKMQKAEQKSVHILLDMHDVNIINSGSIGVLIRNHKDLQIANGGIAIINASEQLREVFENSGLVRIIPIFRQIEDYEAALESAKNNL